MNWIKLTTTDYGVETFININNAFNVEPYESVSSGGVFNGSKIVSYDGVCKVVRESPEEIFQKLKLKIPE